MDDAELGRLYNTRRWTQAFNWFDLVRLLTTFIAKLSRHQ